VRRLGSLSLGVVLFSAVLLVCAAEAGAAACGPASLDLERGLGEASLVFVGTVQDVRDLRPGITDAGIDAVTFSVDDVWKGTAFEVETVKVNDWQWGLLGSGTPGERMLAFADDGQSLGGAPPIGGLWAMLDGCVNRNKVLGSRTRAPSVQPMLILRLEVGLAGSGLNGSAS